MTVEARAVVVSLEAKLDSKVLSSTTRVLLWYSNVTMEVEPVKCMMLILPYCSGKKVSN